MKILQLVFILLLCALLAGCAAPAAPAITPCPTSVTSNASACALPSKTPPALPAGALFQLMLADGKMLPFGLAELKALALTPVSMDSKPVQGYRLLDVLQVAGVSEFSQVTFNGETTLTLKKEQLPADLVLVSGGSVRLAAPGLPAEQQVKAITTIRVK